MERGEVENAKEGVESVEESEVEETEKETETE